MSAFLQKVWAFIKLHWPAILAFALAFWAKFGSQIQAYITAHPNLSIAYALVSFVVAYYLKSPVQKNS
jgi:FtsH-binding integral membrane protein